MPQKNLMGSVDPLARDVPEFGFQAPYLLFEIGGNLCSIAAQQVQQIVFMATLLTPPGLPSAIAGFLNLRGVTVPILDAAHIFFVPATGRQTLHLPVLILRSAKTSFGLIVDRVRHVVSAESRPFERGCSDCVFNQTAVAAITHEGEPIPMISVDRILIEKESRLLAEFQLMVQARLQGMEAT